MTPRSPLGKYAPLLAIAVVQLLVILLVPSTAQKTDALAANGGYATGTAADGTGGAAGADLTGQVGAAAGAASSQLGAAGGGSGGTAAAGGAGGGAAPPGTVLVNGKPVSVAQAAGDKSHCVGGRQFSQAIDPYAPPCVAGVPGAPYPGNNGGATWQGVTKDKIELVIYVPDYGTEVNTILKAQGLYYDKAAVDKMTPVLEKFINSHYQLYGRKVNIDSFQGTCSTVPPELKCLLPEMNKMVDTFHPYAVTFVTTLCSACYTELSRRGVVNTGASGFSDQLLNSNAPYMYSVPMSSTKIEMAFAKFWCQQMTSKGGSGRTAIYAGDQNPAQDFRKKPRQLGIVATNDPDIENTVKKVLYPALQQGCGDSVGGHEYFYANDISNATQQSQAGTAKMNTTSNPATSVLCLCDPVAPQFSYNAAENNNYYPEPLIASNQAMDIDAAGQTYESGVSCPKASTGKCPFDGAMGLGSEEQDVPSAQLPVTKVFKAGGGGSLPISDLAAQGFWDNLNMILSMVQNTGPQLTPARMQAAAPLMGTISGGAGHARRGFAKGDWSWTRDVKMVFWNKHATSAYNGKAGKWIAFGGKRFLPNEFPQAEQPAAPPASGRS